MSLIPEHLTLANLLGLALGMLPDSSGTSVEFETSLGSSSISPFLFSLFGGASALLLLLPPDPFALLSSDPR